MDLWFLFHPLLIELLAWLLGPAVLVLLLLGPGDVNSKGVVRAQLRALGSSTWGAYHRLSHGKYLGNGERELFRTDVRVMRISPFNGEPVERSSMCILTNYRLIVANPADGAEQIFLPDIGAVRAFRDYDPRSGFFSWLIVDHTGSPQSGLCLRCETSKQGSDLMSRIRSARSYARPERAPALIAGGAEPSRVPIR
jgi:hypothetical protein